MSRLFALVVVAVAAWLAVAASKVEADDALPPPPESAPRWFRGNLHTHSLWSDGNDYPEMIVDWYARHGYQFLALSDHNVLSQGQRWMNITDADRRSKGQGFARYRSRFGDDWVETRVEKGQRQVRLKPLGEFRTLFEQPGTFLLIQGEEITDKFESRPIHMNASNVLEVIKPQGGKSVVDTMTNNLTAVEAQAKKHGRPILAHLNHPNFGYAITAEELAMVTKERYYEVYNGHPDTHQTGDEWHAGVERMWDIVSTLRIGEMKVPPILGIATDDSHNYFGHDGSTPGRGWVMARARFLTPEAVIHAFETRDFYASSGVSLTDFGFDAANRTLRLKVQAVEGVTYTTQFLGTRKGYDPTRKPVVGKDGKPLPVTQRYSQDVGATLATVSGTEPSYTLRGDELYVRAVVTASAPPSNPSYPGQKAQAWVQPFGWESWLTPTLSDPEPTAKP